MEFAGCRSPALPLQSLLSVQDSPQNRRFWTLAAGFADSGYVKTVTTGTHRVCGPVLWRYRLLAVARSERWPCHPRCTQSLTCIAIEQILGRPRPEELA